MEDLIDFSDEKAHYDALKEKDEANPTMEYVLKIEQEEMERTATRVRIAEQVAKMQARDEFQDKHVVVILDGNTAMFHSKYVSEARPGGWKAANDLKSAVREHFNSIRGDKQDLKVIVKIFADTHDVERQYPRWDNYQQFVYGFHSFRGQFEIVDVGPSIEGVCEYTVPKVKRALKFYLEDLEFHVILGIPFNKKYEEVLEPLRGSKKLILVDCINQSSGGSDIFKSFEMISLKNCMLDRTPVAEPVNKRKVFHDRIIVEPGDAMLVQSMDKSSEDET